MIYYFRSKYRKFKRITFLKRTEMLAEIKNLPQFYTTVKQQEIIISIQKKIYITLKRDIRKSLVCFNRFNRNERFIIFFLSELYNAIN